jgi:hypothetical protein
MFVNSLQAAKLRWEKAFDKEMTEIEWVMFSWGYAYALSDMSVDTSVSKRKEE